MLSAGCDQVAGRWRARGGGRRCYGARQDQCFPADFVEGPASGSRSRRRRPPSTRLPRARAAHRVSVFRRPGSAFVTRPEPLWDAAPGCKDRAPAHCWWRSTHRRRRPAPRSRQSRKSMAAGGAWRGSGLLISRGFSPLDSDYARRSQQPYDRPCCPPPRAYVPFPHQTLVL